VGPPADDRGQPDDDRRVVVAKPACQHPQMIECTSMVARNCRTHGIPFVYMTYTMEEQARAAAWKAHTRVLPAGAKQPAPYVGKDGRPGGMFYDFCLPPALAEHTLLPEVRATALALFAELGIPWHASVDGGPSNHLLSSQVQCVNALTQMASDPTRLVRAFGELLGIAEVLEIESGRYLTFEYIGPEDFFGESPKVNRIRGAHCTSVDAAFLHRGVDGVVELVLVEWKYTESYQVRPPDPVKDEIRYKRYGEAVADPEGPVRADLLSFEDLLDEPFYQLVRQQLLAHALEKSSAEGASRVRVLHVLPHRNEAYQLSLARPEQRVLGESVNEVWQKLLRHTDRFISIDSQVFLDADITSREYVLRYADGIIHDEQELLTGLDVDDARGIEDALEFDGDVELLPDGVDLRSGTGGTGFSYPFALTELRALADELAAD
jgi:hypothetical protein